jgi:hypothetical protein
MEEPRNLATTIDVNGQTKMTYDLIVDVDEPIIEVQQVHHLAIVAQVLIFCKFVILPTSTSKESNREITFSGL